jgi:DNA-binding response OmpR family regulator
MLHEWNTQHPDRCAFAAIVCDLLAKGLERVKEGGIDLIVSDLSLPDSGGQETIRSLSEEASHLPVIFLTSLADESVGTHAVAHGAQEYLVKGELEPNLLVRTFHYAIERKRFHDQLHESREALHQQQLLTREQQLKFEEQTIQMRTLREITMTLMDRINNPLSIILMTFEIWQRDHRLSEEMQKNLETLQQAAFKISDSLREAAKMEQYKTIKTSYGKFLDLHTRAEIEANAHQTKATLR